MVDLIPSTGRIKPEPKLRQDQIKEMDLLFSCCCDLTKHYLRKGVYFVSVFWHSLSRSKAWRQGCEAAGV